MKKNLITIALLAATTAGITSCRTNEANYRAAYEQAVAGREDTSGIDNTVYDKIRREAVSSYTIYEGDSIPLKRERVSLVDPTPGTTLSHAYVVVAQFKQKFNAGSLAARLVENGYADATVLVTREPLYYVAIASGDRTDMILRCREIAANPPVPVKEPYPLVLETVGKR